MVFGGGFQANLGAQRCSFGFCGNDSLEERMQVGSGYIMVQDINESIIKRVRFVVIS